MDTDLLNNNFKCILFHDSFFIPYEYSERWYDFHMNEDGDNDVSILIKALDYQICID